MTAPLIAKRRLLLAQFAAGAAWIAYAGRASAQAMPPGHDHSAPAQPTTAPSPAPVAQLTGLTATLLSSGGPASGFRAPTDAALTSDGSSLVFLAQTLDGRPGVWLLALNQPDAQPVSLVTGSPLAAPSAIVVSSDGSTAYVADPKVDRGGVIFNVPLAGGDVSVLPASAGLVAGSLDLRSDAAGDEIIVGGYETPDAAHMAVYGVSPTKGKRWYYHDYAFARWSGLVADGHDNVYMTGPLQLTGNTAGVILRWGGDGPRKVVPRLAIGNPGGLSRTRDGAYLLASTVSEGGTATITRIDTRTGAMAVENTVLAQYWGAGGLHRQPDGDLFTWVAPASDGFDGAIYSLALDA